MERCGSANIEPIHFEDRAGVGEESRYLLHDAEAKLPFSVWGIATVWLQAHPA